MDVSFSTLSYLQGEIESLDFHFITEIRRFQSSFGIVRRSDSLFFSRSMTYKAAKISLAIPGQRSTKYWSQQWRWIVLSKYLWQIGRRTSWIAWQCRRKTQRKSHWVSRCNWVVFGWMESDMRCTTCSSKRAPRSLESKLMDNLTCSPSIERSRTFCIRTEFGTGMSKCLCNAEILGSSRIFP